MWALGTVRTTGVRAGFAAALALPLLLSACSREGGETSAPWLTMPSQDQHADRYFPFGPGTTHTDATCDDCHGGVDTFARFECRTCHSDQTQLGGIHSGMVGYRFESAACYTCHTDGTAAGIDHTGFFRIGAGSQHATAQCADCHVSPASRSVLGCAGCHPHTSATTATEHARVPDFAFDSAACVRCHADSQVDTVAGHLPFRVDSGPHQGLEGGACLECHPAAQQTRPWAADFAVKDCLGCHTKPVTDPIHVSTGSYAWTTAACLGCHDDGSSVDHVNLFPIALGSAHEAATCSECHTNTTDRTVLGCAGCHPHTAVTSATQHALVGGYSFASPACVRCHAESQVNTLAVHLPFVITGGDHSGNDGGRCLMCHPAMRADRAWAADFAVVDCLGCHGRTETDNEHVGETGYAYLTSECLRCHPAGRSD